MFSLYINLNFEMKRASEGKIGNFCLKKFPFFYGKKTFCSRIPNSSIEEPKCRLFENMNLDFQWILLPFKAMEVLPLT